VELASCFFSDASNCVVAVIFLENLCADICMRVTRLITLGWERIDHVYW